MILDNPFVFGMNKLKIENMICKEKEVDVNGNLTDKDSEILKVEKEFSLFKRRN